MVEIVGSNPTGRSMNLVEKYKETIEKMSALIPAFEGTSQRAEYDKLHEVLIGIYENMTPEERDSLEKVYAI